MLVVSIQNPQFEKIGGFSYLLIFLLDFFIFSIKSSHSSKEIFPILLLFSSSFSVNPELLSLVVFLSWNDLLQEIAVFPFF